MATWQHLRSSTANKRPTTSLADGRIAINTNTASPGLFFKDSAGTGIVKVGPVHVGTTAPNSVPASGGSSGNYLGEQWLDISVSPAQMKVWNGSTWVGIVADELPVSKLQDGAARQLIQTDAAGTGVEWTSNVDVPGTLDVTGASTLDSTLSVAGVATFAAGSAGSPSLTFTGDTNTGIYSPGADQVSVATGGTERLRIDAAGQIEANGLGSAAAPAYSWIGDLNTGIYSPGADQVAISTNGSQRLLIDSTGQIEAAGLGSASAPAWSYVGDPNTGIFSPTADTLAITTGGSERLRVDSSGRLGLGISSPTRILQVANAPDTTNPTNGADFSINNPGLTPTQINSTTAGLGVIGIAVNYAGDHHLRSFWGVSIDKGAGNLASGASNTVNSDSRTFAIRQFAGGTTWATQFCVNGSGNVGIGTTSPGSALEINAAAATSPFIAKINTAEAARIDSSGRLLVGTSSSRNAYLTDPAILQVERVATGGTTASLSLTDNRADPFGPILGLLKTRGTSNGAVTVVQSGDTLGAIAFSGTDGTNPIFGSLIEAKVDGTPGTNDMPGRLVFSTTADGSSGPTERLRITSAGVLQVADAGNITVGTTTGTKIGTATTQKIGFYNATPVVQPTAVADATTATDVITQLNALLAKLRTLGIIAT
jgi:hypothetical protein